MIQRAMQALVVRDMQAWIERAVIGLNLCPFAKSVHVKGQVRYVVSLAGDTKMVRDELRRELLALQDADPEVHDTTLLMTPHCLGDFVAFNDFLAQAQALLHRLGLEGELQIASFHPQFQFAGTSVDDITNHTNRAPWPTLHLLRESSIDLAVKAFPEAETIYEKNMETLTQLGPQGWTDLGVGPSHLPDPPEKTEDHVKASRRS